MGAHIEAKEMSLLLPGTSCPNPFAGPAQRQSPVAVELDFVDPISGPDGIDRLGLHWLYEIQGDGRKRLNAWLGPWHRGVRLTSQLAQTCHDLEE